MNKHFFLFIILGLFIFSCKETKEETKNTDSANNNSIRVKPPRKDTIINLEESETLMMGKYETYSSLLNPIVMRDSIPLYFEIRDTFIIKKMLPILTPCKILESGGVYIKQKKIRITSSSAIPEKNYIIKNPFYKIAINGDSGYVNANDICYYHLKNPNKPIYYFVRASDFSDEIILYKYDGIKKKVIDSLTIEMGGSDSEVTPDTIKFRDDIALNNVQGILEIYRADEYCGGGNFSIFVIDAKDSLCELVRVSASGEMCEGSSTTITFPSIKNGDTISNIDWKRKGLKEKIDKIGKNKKIPIHQIIPENTFTYSGTYDENEGLIYNKDNTCKTIVNENYTILYSWDGYKLNKLDSVNHLK